MSETSDVNQLLEILRQQNLIRRDIADLQTTPIHERDDGWYKMIAILSTDFDVLEDDKQKLIKRIPSGQAFYAWLVSRFQS